MGLAANVDDALASIRREIRGDHVDTRSARSAGRAWGDGQPRGRRGSGPTASAASNDRATTTVLGEGAGRRVDIDLSQNRKGGQAKRQDPSEEIRKYRQLHSKIYK